MISIIQQGLSWLVTNLPAFAIRWYYRPRLSRQIEVDLCPRGDPLTFDCGEAPYVSMWFCIRNGTPFSIEIDRMRVDLWCEGHRIGDLFYLDRTLIPKGTSKDVLIRGLSGGRYRRLVLSQGQGRYSCSAHAHAEFESKVGRIIVDTRQLDRITPFFTNVSAPAELA